MSGNGDYISREATIKKLDHFQSHLHTVEGTHTIGVAKTLIKEIPTADVRPVVRGEWEDVEVTYVADKTTLPFERISSMRCNQCNRYHTEIYYYGNPTEMANFCPNCGADMGNADD